VHATIRQCWFHEIKPAQRWKVDMFRGDPRSFAADALALALTHEAVAAQADQALSPDERVVLYMPCMHSESKLIHGVAEDLF
jgi:uncharacterized protein (DUF924 family)